YGHVGAGSVAALLECVRVSWSGRRGGGGKLVGKRQGKSIDKRKGGKGRGKEKGEAYLVQLYHHDAASLDRALGPDTARAAHIAADVRAADVGDRAVRSWRADALGAVGTVSLRHIVGPCPWGGRRIMSTPSTQSCWKVACEATWWAMPR